MNWYKKYLTVYEKDFEVIPIAIIKEISENLRKSQNTAPIASIVIIAHNEEKRLLSCLWSLSENYTNYPIEIIGVNNNSTDRTSEVFEAVGVPCFFEERKGPGFARDCGQNYAKGKYYICIDSDTIYPPYYIQMMISKLEKPGVVGAYALWSFIPDKKFPEWKLFIYELLRDMNLILQSFKRPELCVRGMVFAYNLELGKAIGYNHNIIRGEDGSMAFNLKKYGKIVFVLNRKARAITSNSILHSEGSILKATFNRIIKTFRYIGGYFTGKKFYKDVESNMINKMTKK